MDTPIKIILSTQLASFQGHSHLYAAGPISSTKNQSVKNWFFLEKAVHLPWIEFWNLKQNICPEKWPTISSHIKQVSGFPELSPFVIVPFFYCALRPFLSFNILNLILHFFLICVPCVVTSHFFVLSTGQKRRWNLQKPTSQLPFPLILIETPPLGGTDTLLIQRRHEIFWR